jgi:integrase
VTHSTHRQRGRSRFSPTPLGFLRYRWKSGAKLQRRSWIKWRPILLQIEELREQIYGAPWCDLDPEDIAYDLINQLYRRCKSKKGGEASSNTLRGRYDAAKIYFDFLVLIGALDENPCKWQRRPSNKAKHRPFLEPSEDEMLARLPKEGHELAVYALARGAALREEEICDLDQSDVDFDNNWIFVREGKTDNAMRGVPILPAVKVMLLEYASWRDQQPGRDSTKFVRTRSGTISKAYIWKLTKAMALRANLRTVREAGEVMLDPTGAPLTDVTPHALRRTFITDFGNRGVPTFVLAPIVGHSSARVTEESYAMASKELQAKQLLLAAGDGVLSMGQTGTEFIASLDRARALVATDANAALQEARRLRNLATQLEQSLTAMIAEPNERQTLRAVA